MAEVKWIKVSTDIFNNRKIKQIENMPDGDAILVIWIKLLCLAGTVNDGGAIYLTPEIPYTEDMLATEIGKPLNTVRLALGTFERFGMIEIVDNFLRLSSWEKYQNTDRLSELREYNREAKRKSREKKKLQAVNDMSLTCQRGHDTEEEREEDIEEEKEYSFYLSGTQKSENVEKFVDKSEARQAFLNGSLGKGVVFMSEEQVSDLLDKLSIEEFDHYVGVIADCELKGKHFGKTHYQAILDMAAKDRKLRP